MSGQDGVTQQDGVRSGDMKDDRKDSGSKGGGVGENTRGDMKDDRKEQSRQEETAHDRLRGG